jgi:hypothetical protein
MPNTESNESAVALPAVASIRMHLENVVVSVPVHVSVKAGLAWHLFSDG